MRKAIAFLTVFVMSISLFAQSDVAKYGDKGAPEVRIPQTWNSNTNRTEDFLLVLTDSWGDGWDGAYMDVLVNGTLVYDDITVASATEEFTLALDDGDVVQTAYTAGSYENEHSYAFYDNNGTYVAGDGPYPGAGIEFTASVSSDVPGCMTAAACNYNAQATADDGSCCLTNCTTIAMGGGSYISETSWEITDAAGNIIASGAGTTSSEFSCLDDGDYTVTAADSYGDGWNGNFLTVTDDDGTVWLSFEVTSAAGAGEVVTATFTVGVPPPAVFFSEYAEGSSNNKYLEVYNGTDATINLDDFVILGNYNGNPWSETFTFVAGATVESGGVYVIANSSASDGIQALADELLAYGDPWYTAAFNGDDVRALATADGTVLDIIGTLDGDGDGTSGEGSEDDPGGGFDVAGVSEATKDNTLRRKDEVVEGNGGDWAASAGTTADDSEYIVEERPTADYTPATLGWHLVDPNVTYSANFAIDMNGTGYPNETYPSVVINGSWNGWAGWGVELADADMDGIYTGTLSDLVDATMIEYVVSVTGESDGWSGWGVTFNAPVGSDCDYFPTDEWGNYGFTIMGADVNLAHIAGSCITCNENLVAVHMNDSYGDGWNGNVLTIYTDSLTIEAGSYAFAELCLNDGTYSVYCGGGSYQGEVSWVMMDAAGNTLLEGGAPYSGVLQLGETNDVLGCTDADALNYDENATVDDGSCYYAGDSCSIALDAVAGANDASGAEQWFSYTATLDGFITATTCYEGQTEDTDVDVYDACGGNMIASSDDAMCGGVTGGNNYASHVEFPVVTGETYYIFWDDTWNPGANTWYLYESLPPTNPENLTAEAGLESVFLEWDGVIPASNRSAAIVQERRLTIEDTNERNLAKMREVKGDEPTEVHIFGVVHPDYASSSRSTDVIIECDGGDWQSEVSWDILNEAGEIIVSGGAPSGQLTASLDNGVYTVNGYDSYGDGWNGNVLTVTGATDSYPWLSFTIPDGDFATAQFTMSDTPPELANLNLSDLHYDEVQDAVIITINNTGGLSSGEFFITYYRSMATSDVCENEDYDDWDYIENLEADSSMTYAILEDASYWMGYDTFDIGAFVDWGCMVNESNEDDNTITTTVEIINPFAGVTWNVYQSQDAGASFELVGVAESQDYLDEGLTGDVEYCYYVTQVNTEGEAESDTSNHACATAIPMADLPTPTDLVGEADGWNVNLNWTAPDVGGGAGGGTEDFEGGAIPDGWDMTTNAIDCGDFVGWYVTMDGTSAYWTVPAGDGYYAVSNDDECNSDGSVDYLHAPSQDFTDGGLTLSFRSFYTGAYSQTGHVLVSVDGGASYTEVYAVVAGTEWADESVNLGAYGGESDVRVIFHSNDNEVWASGWAVDNISFSNPADFDFLAYSVYRNGEAVGMIESLNATSFDEFVAEEGDHVYYVTATYDFYGESDPSNSDTVTVEAPAPLCNAPQNLEAEALGNDVSLSWDAPEGGAGWFGYNDGIFATAIGLNQPAEFSVAIRFGQEELQDYNGMALTKVRFAHNEPTAFYQVAIWTAEFGGEPVLLDTTEWMDGAEIPANEFYDVELDESIIIDWTQELWIGYNINTPTGWPAGCDGGPAVTGYGDLISLGGPFQSMNAAYGLNYNWLIDGFADYADGRSIASMAPINVEYSAPTITKEPEEHRLADPIAIDTPDERNMINYIVYRDGEAEDTLGIGDNAYNDIDVEWGDHSYYVTALYNNSEECGESEPSNTADVSLYNNPPPPVMLLQPDDGATIAVDE